MKNLTTDTVVIGGGAAGMLAAAVAASKGGSVILVEPNRFLGKKLRITGKGRCNVTNNCDVKELMTNIPGNNRFLYSAFHALSPQAVMELFEELGVPLKTERGNRVFPVSNRAGDIADALERYGKRSGVSVYRDTAKQILTENGAVTGVRTENSVIPCRNVILCTGGLSYPGTGSTGDGYRMARELGHTVTPLYPSLVPLESKDDYCAEMQGFSLRNVTLSVYNSGNQLLFRELGEMLFTHFGVSGPLVLSASAHMQDFAHDSYRFAIDLKPGLDEKKLDARILRDFEKYANREFKNALNDLAGKAMIPVLVRLSGIPGETKVNSITRKQRHKLVTLFKQFPVSICGTRPIAEAIVTKGGIDLREVNPRTMQSKLIEGLYFAGEILDLSAYTGGFNLQIAWSTAYVAGNAVW
ncbi:MAG: NAD(P)/FAD-dependent oxidoreductase [Oscillospiraceae bacterium]